MITETLTVLSRQEWRQWLETNHDRQHSVWLIFFKNRSGITTMTWSEAVDEALCYGWIDSVARPLDENRFLRYFSKRKVKSVWSKINKDKADRLMLEGRMKEAGMASIEAAKQNGSWTKLDQVEALAIPADLQKALRDNPAAQKYIESLSRSVKKALLQWLEMASRVETRKKRITEIVLLGSEGLLPKAIQWSKKPADPDTGASLKNE